MCGIAGIRSSSVDTDYPRVTAAAMTRRLAHRGPDASGIWVDIWHGVALGHRRLAVIDPTPAGQQPMVSSSGRFVITYNGEIYNYKELAQELPTGSILSSSDTAVLLACLDEWGLDQTLERVNGMFAFGLWDRWTGTLFLVTDRLGEKPLYFASVGSDVIFASELKALTVHDMFDGVIDAVALDQYLKKGFVPAPRSIFRQISKLEPGSVAVIRRGAAPQVRRYWSPAAPQANHTPLNLHEAVETLDGLLKDSVRLRLRSDVPLGVFFSGGIDSTAVLAQARRASGGPITAFTIDFEEADHSEASHARALARYLDCDHVEATLSSNEALAIIPELPTIYDEPFGDSSSIAVCLLARVARSHVTVALGGDGGDELFCGYLRYHWANRFWPLWRDAPAHVRRAAESALSASSTALGMLPWMPSRVTRLATRLERISDCLSSTDTEVLYQHLTAQRDAGRFLPQAATENSWLHPMPTSRDELLAQLMWLDTTDYLPNDILVKVDRATMAVGLEARLPMLDHRLVEWAATLPANVRLRGGVGKRLLKHLLYRDIPRLLLDRPKQGFALPVAAWLRGPLRDWAEDLLSERSLQGQSFLDAIEVRRQWTDHMSGRRDWRHSLWPLLMFLSWERHMRATRVIPSAGSDFAAVAG
jgi:asparagine synthase (glutamine-hydrolysing)